MRLPYPTNVRIVQVPCTGRVDVLHLLKPLEQGADGVYVSGCLPGECHYISGNLKAAKRVARVQKLIEALGVEPERVGIVYNSASMGPQFAQCCRDITERLRALGPIYSKD
ncbi:MAG: hydrogenase iron-sulfur subunit [Desulfosoma sp.]